MKKISQLLMIAFLSLVLVACQDSEAENENQDSSVVESSQAPEASESSAESTSSASEESSQEADSSEAEEEEENYRLRVGVTYSEQELVWRDVSRRINQQDPRVEIDATEYRDAHELNYAYMDREIDILASASIPALYYYNTVYDLNLVPVANLYLSPAALYLQEDVEDLNNQVLGIASDPVDQAHTLEFLNQQGIIQLEDQLDPTALVTLDDIAENPYQLIFVEFPKVSLVNKFKDGDFDILATDIGHAVDQALDQNLLYLEENPDNTKEMFYVTLAVDEEYIDHPVTQAIIEAYQSQETVAISSQVAQNAYIPVWSENENVVEDYASYVEERKKEWEALTGTEDLQEEAEEDSSLESEDSSSSE